MNMMTLKIDTSVYPLEAIQAAAYSLTGRAYARIARGKGVEASVTLKAKEGGDAVEAGGRASPAATPFLTAAGDGARTLEDEFYNELLHQTLRLKVSENNRKIREYVVTKALVSAQVPSSPPGTEAPGSSAQAAGPDPNCPECQAEAQARQASASGAERQAPPVDEELEKEIEKLLAEIEKSGPSSDDPLGVAVPWEEKHGGAKPEKPMKTKAKGRKKA
ncbi:MAG: hypothetical protein HY748_06580 [Elusimicrobia bacterium]|nr:hypothetical protein [Elusimicrobiota bacterium]